MALPEIPNKRYFSISEAATLCDVKAHVLRYWEQEFPSLSPSKRRNRRYYLRDDILVIRHIRALLYDKGFTISGAKAQLVANKKRVDAPAEKPMLSKLSLVELIADLKAMREQLKS